MEKARGSEGGLLGAFREEERWKGKEMRKSSTIMLAFS